ncbi:MAG: hypothetical protein GY871_11840, partial [Actinomycetales bacterium]|nr:hypothetical protein [Actinomycetales bacterium]
MGLQSDAVVRGLTIRGARAGSPLGGNPDSTAGAGIWVRNSTVLIEDCVLDDNACHFGGGIYVKGGTGSISSTVFTSNEAYNGGGGLYLFDAAMEVVDCVFQGNVAGSEGGGSRVTTGASSFTNCSFTGNVANGGGGLSWSPTDSANSLVLTGCSITGNQGLTWAGGIAAQPDLPGVTLFSTILCGNIADDPETNQFYGDLIDDGSNTICPNVDCDGNGIEDGDEIADGTANDCDLNGVPDACDPDVDGDGTIDACDGCPEDPNKTDPGTCGCGAEDIDSDGDGLPDCVENEIDAGIVWSTDQGGEGQLYAQVVFSVGVTWAEARAFAVGLGGDLASIATNGEAAVIKPYLLGQDVFRGWIGLYQDVSAPDFAEPAGGWRWSDGTPLVYTDWLDGEPSNQSLSGLAEDFGMIAGAGNQPPLGWNDKAGRLPTALIEWSDDCDGNGVIDRIEVLNGGDCNGNGQLDACDVLSGESLDVNQNLVPDECEDTLEFDVPGSFATIAAAIDAALDGSVITLGAGTYNEAIDFGSKNLVLQGDASDPSSVVLDGSGLEVPVVTIVGLQSDAVVRGLTIRGARAGSPLNG